MPRTFYVRLSGSYHPSSRRSIHVSTPLFHHLPRDPNIPFIPRHRPLPLFPGLSKKIMGKLAETRTNLARLDPSLFKKFYKNTSVVGNLIGLYGIYRFEKSKELEEGRKKEAKEREEERKKESEEMKQNIKQGFEKILSEVKKEGNGRLMEKKKAVELVLKMTQVQVLEKYKVVQKLSEMEDLMLLFLGASNEERLEIIAAILAGDV